MYPVVGKFSSNMRMSRISSVSANLCSMICASVENSSSSTLCAA
ncbi:unknown [Bacteroides sp. CAG:1060]|nr:unknown [Bacteroides sp. CAG:1060]